MVESDKQKKFGPKKYCGIDGIILDQNLSNYLTISCFKTKYRTKVTNAHILT